jgi:hypothetical protein
MTTKHTPGPWIVRYDTQSALEEHSTPIVSSLDGNIPVCEMYSVATYHANAALIAAAPDLLAACEAFAAAQQAASVDGARSFGMYADAMEAAYAAIAKARGEG